MNPPLPFETRRSTPRLQYTLSVRLGFSGGGLDGYSVDFSATSLFFATAELIPVGTSVDIEFMLPDRAGPKPVSARGRVARQVTLEEHEARGLPPGLGIYFEELVLGKSALEAFIDARLESASSRQPTTLQPATSAAPAPSPAPPVVAQPESPGRPARAASPRRSSRPARTDPQRSSSRSTPPIPPSAVEETSEAISESFAAHLPVRWGDIGPLDRQGLLSQLSSSGAFVGTKEPARTGTPIRLWFELPLAGLPKTMKVTATVTRTDIGTDSQPAGMEVTFDGPEDELGNLHLFTAGQLYHKAALEEEASRYRAPSEAMSVDSRTSPVGARAQIDWRRTARLAGLLGIATVALFLLAVGFVSFFGHL